MLTAGMIFPRALPEIALAGRSNVGSLSLMRWPAKTWPERGVIREKRVYIHFYLINKAFVLWIFPVTGMPGFPKR